MGRSSKGPCLDCLSSYDGATSTARKGFVPGPAAAGSTSGTLWASFRQNLMSCRPLCQELWYDFYMILVHFLPHQATLDALRAACVRRTGETRFR